MFRRLLYLIIALILCAIIWWIGPLVAIGNFFPLRSFWSRIIPICLIAGFFLWPFVAATMSWLFQSVRAPKLDFKRSRQRDRVSSRFYDAINTLRHIGESEQKSFLKRLSFKFKKSYLNQKPWFLIMGPEGVGKTSIINECGKRFLLSEAYGFSQTSDVGATRDCNWWLTEKAVYIDTAGEWLQLNGQSEEATRAQNTLFSLIRRYRRQPPIDAIILTLDASWLLAASITERKTLADTLRARILDIASTFRCNLAVYLAVNGVDNLPGGETFLSMMGEDMLNQGLGMSLAMDADGFTNFCLAEVDYQAFSSRVSSNVHNLLHNSYSASVRQQLLYFTESIGALGKPLFHLLEQIFPQSPVGYAARVQSIWLGSTRMLQPSSGMEGVAHNDILFTGHIYSPMLDTVVHERGIMNSRMLPARQRAGMILRYVFVSVLLLLVCNTLFTRYLWEEDYISWLSARFDETRRIVREIPITNRIGDDLVSAYEQLGYMSAQIIESDSPVLNPYFEHQLVNQASEQTYHRHLFKFFWPAMERYVLAEMAKDITSNDADVYNTLKVYLMLGKPEYRSASALENWFRVRWNSFAPQGYSNADQRLFMAHLRELFSEKLADETPVTKLNPELIRMARIKAMNIPVHVRVLRDIQPKVLPAQIEDVSLAMAAGTNVSLMLRRKSQVTVSDMGVPAFYTQASYRDVFLPNLDDAVKSMLEEETWVMQDNAGKGSVVKNLTNGQKLADEVRKLYLLEYANNWEAFLKDIQVRPINGLEDAAQLARQFSDPSSPLANLLRFVTRQTSLSDPESAGMTGWFNKKRTALESARRDMADELNGERSRFRITPEKQLEQRFEVIRRLGSQLIHNTGSDPLVRTFDEMYNQLTSLSISLRAGEVVPQDTAISRLRVDAARQPEPVRTVMKELLDVGNDQSKQISRNNLNRGAMDFVNETCKSAVAGRYPFLRSSKQEMGISDFARIFGPNGSIKHYYDQNLASYVNRSAGKLIVRADKQGLITPAALKTFENALQISDTFFNANDKVSFSMFVQPVSLTPDIVEAVLDIDGQIIRYSHGVTQPVNINWPGKNGGAYVRLSFKDARGRIETINFNGPWALFHLYDKSNPVSVGNDRRELTMAISSLSGYFKLELLSTMKDFPLWSRALSQFSCR